MKNTNSLQGTMLSQLSGKKLFDKAQEYAYKHLETILSRNVFPTKEAINNLEVFEEPLPAEPGNAENVLDQLHTYGSPATVANLGGRYFGFVTGSTVPVGLAAKNLATFWDQAPAMYVTSPIGSKLEAVVEGWLKSLFNLPSVTVAGFVSGTSMANFCGLAAARYRILQKQGWDINEKGLFNAPKIKIVTGKHAHSTVLKAIGLLGLGKENIEWVDVDNQGRILADELPSLNENTMLILQAGNVNSGSFDDFDKICKKAKQAGAWIHIDGAFGLWAGAVKKLKHLTAGMEKATSWAVDGHKTLNTPYDCGIVLCADKEALSSALHMSGSYIITSSQRDGMFYTPEMSRRARIIELWAIMKYLGKSGIDQMIYNMHLRAKQFAEEISKTERIEVLNDVVFNQVIVSCSSDELTERTMKKVQELNTCWAGGSVWFGRKVIRVSICSWATTDEDIKVSVGSFKEALRLATNKM
ncbi:MAG: pyridoxal phosphate-dependent decarboxylase family protein [Candidatus Cyclobacteriaceae bacterium M2_1C_046]